MTDKQLIAQQAKEIAGLKETVYNYKNNCKQALGYLICIGGPLNDNRDGYNKKQLLPLFKIQELLRA